MQKGKLSYIGQLFRKPKLSFANYTASPSRIEQFSLFQDMYAQLSSISQEKASKYTLCPKHTAFYAHLLKY